MFVVFENIHKVKRLVCVKYFKQKMSRHLNGFAHCLSSSRRSRPQTTQKRRSSTRRTSNKRGQPPLKLQISQEERNNSDTSQQTGS